MTGVSRLRIIVVDDQPSQRDGRVLWLSSVPGVDVLGMTFEQAMALGSRWTDIQIAVLDGHDRRSPQRREQAAVDAGITALARHDNFVGVRVANLIREHCDPRQTMIIMISAHARDSDMRARRIAQAAVDYVFEHYEVNYERETFVRAILSPQSFSPHRIDVNWPAHGFSSEPDVAGAICALESSPAGAMLLTDEPHHRHPEHEWAVRNLRHRLHETLHGHIAPGSGLREARAPRKSWLADKLRQALGADLPVDPS
jgi:CheY-like chemotaxis protein